MEEVTFFCPVISYGELGTWSEGEAEHFFEERRVPYTHHGRSPGIKSTVVIHRAYGDLGPTSYSKEQREKLVADLAKIAQDHHVFNVYVDPDFPHPSDRQTGLQAKL